jgi:hypothetical protein
MGNERDEEVATFDKQNKHKPQLKEGYKGEEGKRVIKNAKVKNSSAAPDSVDKVVQTTKKARGNRKKTQESNKSVRVKKAMESV